MEDWPDALRHLGLFALLAGPVAWLCSERVRTVCKMAAFYLTIFVVSFLALPAVALRPRRPENHFIVFDLFYMLTPWLRIDYTLRNVQLLRDVAGPCVVVVNHQSSLDVHALGQIWPRRGVIMAKRSLQYAGAFGLSSWLCGDIFVDRFKSGGGAAAKATMDRALERMRTCALQVFVFPEGTRHHGDGLLPFKKGAFHIAAQARCPVVPVVISSYGSFYRKHTRFDSDSGRVILEVLPAVSTDDVDPDDGAGVTELSERVRDTMARAYERLSREVDTMVDLDALR